MCPVRGVDGLPIVVDVDAKRAWRPGNPQLAQDERGYTVDLEELGTNTHSAHLVADIERRPADLGRVSPVRVAEHFREVTHE